jgi:putative spermidine/putrescine transport system ATP-binding protein
MSEPHLKLSHVSKRYGEVTAVAEVSLSIASGEFVTLLGPSGSGKTTTLMMIAGFETPSDGELALDGRCLIGVPAYRRGFGMVFQSYALFPHMTALENIAFPLRMRGINQADRAAAARRALETVRLQDCAGRYPAQLSGGQQQRVALARACVFKPPVLLMDEPLGALDKKLREEMQLEIKRIQREVGITTIYVTHDQEEALVMSDRVAVVNRGRIEQLAAPNELYERPATRFVADFIGESNIVPVNLREEGGQKLAIAEDGTLLPVGVTRTETWCGRQDAGSASGTKRFLMLRPEKLRLADASSSADGRFDCCLEGVVEEIVYIGEATRFRIRVGESLRLMLKQPNRAGESAGLVGARRCITWASEDAVLIEE